MKTYYSIFVLVAITVVGCRSTGRHGAAEPAGSTDTPPDELASAQTTPAAGAAVKPKPVPPKHHSKGDVSDVACIYEQKPWLNLDAAGDRMPEGIRFRVFLDSGSGRGVLRDGTLHVEMYRVTKAATGGLERELVSDWHYSTDALSPVRSKLLGMGYMVRLGWASKDLAGQEVEITARFEQPNGVSATSGTKRFRVPKFAF